MSELIHSMFRPMVAPQPPANTNTNTNNQGANLRGVPSTNNYQAPALRVQRQQVQQRQQVAPVAPVGRICCDHQAALNYFVTRHYNTKRASYDQLCFIVDANGTQRLWKKMSISEMCYVVHTQFNKGDTGEIWKCLNTLKKKGWANAKARRNLRTAVETRYKYSSNCCVCVWRCIYRAVAWQCVDMSQYCISTTCCIDVSL